MANKTLISAARSISIHCIYCEEVKSAPMEPQEYVDFVETHEKQCGPKAVGGTMHVHELMDRNRN